MLSNDPDFTPDVVRSVKELGSHNSFQPKFYKPFEHKPDSGSKHNLSGYGGGHDQPRSAVQQLLSEYNHDHKYHAQVSPKTDPSDWNGAKYGHAGHPNRSMPLTSSGGKIDKNAYLKCNEQIRNPSDSYQRKELQETGQHFEPPFSNKGYADIQ